MGFKEVLDSKIAGLESKKAQVESMITSPKHHVSEVSNAVLSIAPEVEALPEDAERIRKEFISVLNQIPGLVASVWMNAQEECDKLQQEIDNLNQMKRLYVEWVDAEKKKEDREKELLEKIRSGEIKEPTKMTAIRRKPGVKPPVSIGDFRRATKSIEGEDSEE